MLLLRLGSGMGPPVVGASFYTIEARILLPQGPVFIAQLFGLADTMCALFRVRCISWRLFGMAWFIGGPVCFTVLASLKVRRLVKIQQTLKFKPSPHRTIKEMWTGVTTLLGCIPRLSQLFLYFVDLRFVGGWGKVGPEAQVRRRAVSPLPPASPSLLTRT